MLRHMRYSDIERAEMIDSVSHPQYWLAARFKESIDNNDLCLVCEVMGTVLGHCIACIHMDELSILQISVLPQARGYNIGRLFMMAVCAHARAAHVSESRLDVRQSNKPAINLYRFLGYRVVASRPRYYRNLGLTTTYEDSYVMSLHLQETTSPSPQEAPEILVLPESYDHLIFLQESESSSSNEGNSQ